MKKVQVIVKPMGAIALATLIAVVLVGISSVRSRLMQRAEAATLHPVGAAPKTGAATNANSDIDAGEQEEKDLLKTLNTPEQSHDWLFVGPLPSGSGIQTKANSQDAQTQMERIVTTSYLPSEAKYEGHEGATLNVQGKAFHWRKLSGSAFDFKDIFTSPETPTNSLKNVVVYGFTRFNSPKAQKKTLHFRSDDGAIVWLNGQQVLKATKIRGVREEDMVPVKLRAGQNTLLVKVGQGEGGWAMMTHFEDK